MCVCNLYAECIYSKASKTMEIGKKKFLILRKAL